MRNRGMIIIRRSVRNGNKRSDSRNKGEERIVTE